MPTAQATAFYEAASTMPEQDYANALRYHDGDAHAAVRTLLRDCRYLREQLVLTEVAMSIGFTRGWKPSFEREPAGE